LNLYTAVLFVHAVAVLVLTAALTLEAWILLHLRRALRPSDAQPWIGTMPPVAIAAITSLFVTYVTGAYLTESLHSWAYAWPRLAVLEIVIFALLGAMTGRRMRAIRQHSAGEQMNSSEWNALTRSPFLKVSLSTRIWIVMGTILLTAAKPDVRESLLIVVGSLILGLLFSFASFERRSVVSTTQAGPPLIRTLASGTGCCHPIAVRRRFPYVALYRKTQRGSCLLARDFRASPPVRGEGISLR